MKNREFTTAEKESALFKGLYINDFLRIEQLTEEIMISFFQQSKIDASIPAALINEVIN
jgi:hypothetical protein